MPVVISARTSTDAGNSVRFGSDGGLYAPASVAGAPANMAYSIDNSWTPAGQSFAYCGYSAMTTSSVQLGSAQGAYVYPVSFAKSCRVTGVTINSTNPVSGANFYLAMYASDPDTGYPAGKIADLGGTASLASASIVPFVMSDTAPVYLGRYLYWYAFWVNGSATPSYAYRDLSTVLPTRQSAPFALATSMTVRPNAGYYDTSVTWSTRTSAPATVAPSLSPNAFNATVFPPLLWWQLLNT